MNEFFPEGRPTFIDFIVDNINENMDVITQCAPTGAYPAK